MSDLMNRIRMRCWAEIDLDSLEYNYSLVRKKIGNNTKLCCTIKADGYGHGAVKAARLFEKLGADYLAVSNIEEALQLRKNGISLPLLVLGYTPPECAKLLCENNVEQCVYSYEYGSKLLSEAKKQSVKVKIHIKLDTGMGRIGFVCKEGNMSELYGALDLCKNESAEPKGLFTHFAVADQKDSGKEYTKLQYDNFLYAKKFFESHGVIFEIYHCANSAAIFNYPETACNMVRAGIVLYGLRTQKDNSDMSGLRPAMKLCSIISHIKTVEKGESISYGRTFIADRQMKVATVAIGYADGFLRISSAHGYALWVNGKSAKILGRICMDQLMIDVTDIECKVGDTVTVFGDTPPCTADDLANANGTINYEVVCSVGKRVPRAFIKNGRIVEWTDELYSEDL